MKTLQSLPQWQQALHDKACALLLSLESGRLDETGTLLQQLTTLREQGLYRQIGQLTRELHSAITGFQLDESLDKAGSTSKVEGASKRLGYAIELTEQAANRTLDLVEQSTPLAANLSRRAQILAKDCNVLAGQYPELAGQIDAFLTHCAQSASQLGENLNEILLTQGFQDLTGQLIKRVTALVVGIERDLLQLMLTAAGVEHWVASESQTTLHCQQAQRHEEALAKGCGPALSEQAQTQDEVDELLLSLGF